MAGALARLLVRHRGIAAAGRNSGARAGGWSAAHRPYCCATMPPSGREQQPPAKPPQEQRSWDDVLRLLSGLITFKTRSDGKGWRDAFEQLELEIWRVEIR